MLGTTVMFATAGLLLIGLSVPLIRRRVRPNGLYGLRVPATFADEWVWYEANARSGWDLSRLGLVQFAVALLLPFVPGVSREAYGIANAGILTAGALICLVVGWRRANRLLSERKVSDAASA